MINLTNLVININNIPVYTTLVEYTAQKDCCVSCRDFVLDGWGKTEIDAILDLVDRMSNMIENCGTLPRREHRISRGDSDNVASVTSPHKKLIDFLEKSYR